MSAAVIATIVFITSGVACSIRAAGTAPDAMHPEKYALTAADETLLNDIEKTAFQFFLEQSHPVTGLVRDRARADGSKSEGKASVAASGFAFPAWAVAVERGWISRDEALARTRLQLRFLAERAPRNHGFFYHFMEMDTGVRAWKSELSSIDSGILFAGALVAREYFQDGEVTQLVNRLFADIDWTWFLNEGKLMALSWHDETGFSRYRWDKYSEHVLMSFLSLGISPRPLDREYWNRWQRTPLGRYGDYVYLQEPPLFVNQFPQAFIALKGYRDAFVDYFANTRIATLAQRQFSIDLRSEFPAWSETMWGLTASDSATGYKAWGGPPRTLRYNTLDGTIVPCATAGSLPFAPRETLQVLHHLRDAYGDRLWKRYGFVDAFNPQTGWVNTDVISIDQGISLVMAENLRTGFVQRTFMQAPEVKAAFAKAGFLNHERTLRPSDKERLLAVSRQAWARLSAQPTSGGLGLSALIAAQKLGLITGDQLLTAARGALKTPAPIAPAASAEFAASLIVLKQAVPALASLAQEKLDRIDWKALPSSPELGAASRLTVFLQIAARARPPEAWSKLTRGTHARAAVHVLAPAEARGALVPGLWLDERTIITGASAEQLAYASLTGWDASSDPLMAALQLEKFPREVLSMSHLQSPTDADGAAAWLIVAANLLTDDSLRTAFQADPLVGEGRKRIAEFGEAAFAHTSVYAQQELAGAPPIPPQRHTIAVANNLPRDQWNWQEISGLEFKDSQGDVRPGDPPVSLRFAVTWDRSALYFHAEVIDSVKGYTLPPERNRVVELFIDPANDGLIWTGPDDYQFTYRVGVGTREMFHNQTSQGTITLTEEGYTVEGVIPWASIGLEPKPGLEFGLSAAVNHEGTREWEPVIKLNWSYFPLRAGAQRLGTTTLR